MNDFIDVLAARHIYNNLLNWYRTTTRNTNKRPLKLDFATDLVCNHKHVSIPRVEGTQSSIIATSAQYLTMRILATY